jgi:hypothetical protein
VLALCGIIIPGDPRLLALCGILIPGDPRLLALCGIIIPGDPRLLALPNLFQNLLDVRNLPRFFGWHHLLLQHFRHEGLGTQGTK